MHPWKQRLLLWWGPSPKGQEECEVPGQQLGSSDSRTRDCLSMLPRPCYTPPVATAGESRLHSSLPGDWHLQDGAHWDPESSLMSPGRGTAPWLPSPPDPGSGIMSLPSQHSSLGKHNPSTGAQLPHRTPSMAALPLSTVPTAFPQLPIKPSSLTSPGAPPLLLTPPTLPACVTIPAPCSVPRTTQTNPAELTPHRADSCPNTFPLQLAAAGKESAANQPFLTAASLRTPRGQTSLETSPWSWEEAGQVGSSPSLGGSLPTGSRCYCTSLSLKRHQVGAGDGNHGPGEAAGPHRGVCTWAGGGERSSFLDPVCFPV